MNKAKVLIVLLFSLMVSLVAEAQLSSVVTSRDQVIQKKIKTFIVLNEESGFVMAQSPVKYKVDDEMPLCYFTIDNPANLVLPNIGRYLVVHELKKDAGGDQYDWVLENNCDEKDVFFSRTKFISVENSTWWNVLVDNDKVLFQSMVNHGFLKIDEQGDFSMVDDRNAASRWKLIYVY